MSMFALGCLVGVVALALLRVALAAAASMSPWFGVLASPLVALVALLPLGTLEYVLRGFGWKPSTRLQSFALGVVGAVVLLPWIAPSAAWLLIVINPLTLRAFVIGLPRRLRG